MTLPDWYYDGRECLVPEVQDVLDAYGVTMEELVVDIENPLEMEDKDIRGAFYLTPEEVVLAAYNAGILGFSYIGYYVERNSNSIANEYYVLVVAESSSG